MDLTKCLHGNGPECERCKAMDIPEVEEMEAEITSLRASLAAAEERAAKAEAEEQREKLFTESARAGMRLRGRDLEDCQVLRAHATEERDNALRYTELLIAQRDDLAATVAGLRVALEAIGKFEPWKYDQAYAGGAFLSRRVGVVLQESITPIVESALAASPAEHAARLKAAALRSLKEHWHKADTGSYFVYWDVIEDEADRLEKAVGK
jgi:hypothetical protein